MNALAHSLGVAEAAPAKASAPALIKGRQVALSDPWSLVRPGADGPPLSLPALPAGPVIVPFSFWRENRDALIASRPKSERGVWLAPDEEPDDLAPDLPELALVAIDFPAFRDGRGMSGARLLREKHGWKGELRAIGDVVRDTLLYLERCGFDAFSLRPGKDPADAVKAFDEFTLFYQSAADGAEPMFLMRRQILANPGSIGSDPWAFRKANADGVAG
jgi:uncharacterized protein (DUF934 family)